MSITSNRRVEILIALMECGPSPVRISRATGLPPTIVKQLIVGDGDLESAYRERLTEIKHAVRMFGFELQRAAAYLDCTRSELEAYINENPSLHDAINDLRLNNIDMAEQNLARALEKGEWQATQFALERSDGGAQRGYGKIRVDAAREAEQLNIDPRELKARLVRALLADVALSEEELGGKND